MKGHLSDEQWAAAVLDEKDAATAQHLSECPGCRAELISAAAAVDAARTHTREITELPEAFWRKQREAVHARVERRDIAPSWKRWVWVTATIMLILCASIMLSHNSTPSVQSVASTDADDELLLSVQQAIQSDLPHALRPAALLTSEIDRAEAMRRTP